MALRQTWTKRTWSHPKYRNVYVQYDYRTNIYTAYCAGKVDDFKDPADASMACRKVLEDKVARGRVDFGLVLPD